MISPHSLTHQHAGDDIDPSPDVSSTEVPPGKVSCNLGDHSSDLRLETLCSKKGCGTGTLRSGYYYLSLPDHGWLMIFYAFSYLIY
jgi:hypothetical protein